MVVLYTIFQYIYRFWEVGGLIYLISTQEQIMTASLIFHISISGIFYEKFKYLNGFLTIHDPLDLLGTEKTCRRSPVFWISVEDLLSSEAPWKPFINGRLVEGILFLLEEKPTGFLSEPLLKKWSSLANRLDHMRSIISLHFALFWAEARILKI